MTLHTSSSLWSRFWPLYLLSLTGLWPLAEQIRTQLSRIELPPEVAGNPDMLIAAALAQTGVLLLIASVIGAALANRVGMVSILAHRQGFRRLRSELPLAVTLGSLLGITIVVLDQRVFIPLSPGYAAAIHQATASPEQTLLLGLLYGGISEEVLMRWGLMTLVCWLGLRLFGGRRDELPDWVVWASILVSAGVFALGHLPAAMNTGLLDTLFVVRVLLLNSLASIVFGWLYWRRSLESACVAHAVVHVGFHVLS